MGKEQIVVFVQIELLITQRRLLGHEMHTQSAVDHLCLRTKSCSQNVGCIIVSYTKSGATLLQNAVEEGIEHKLRILLVVTYLTTERQSFLTLRQSEIDGVQTYASHIQRMEITISVDARFRRHIHFEEQFLEVYAVTAEQ